MTFIILILFLPSFFFFQIYSQSLCTTCILQNNKNKGSERYKCTYANFASASVISNLSGH